MTANELADKLKLFWHTENDNLFESRQQENIELFVQKCMEVLK